MNFDVYKNCSLCPRDCQVNRTQGKLGVCGETAALRISHIGPHFGEEPSFTGARGSGTIFFSGCSSHCFFCQNYQISTSHEGREYTPETFLAAVKKLIEQDVHNLNFVTPDHFWPHIKDLCQKLNKEKIDIPKIFNSSGYQKPAMIAEYAEFMDIFLPDFKFSIPELARKCMGDTKYPEIAMKAIRNMVKSKGFLEPWDPTGEVSAKRGVLIRHLVLPGHVENSLKVLRLLHQEFGTGIPLSVMSQFQPVPECHKRHDLDCVLTAKEYEQVLELIVKLGLERVYTQELVEKTAFLPNFHDPENPFPGNRQPKTES